MLPSLLRSKLCSLFFSVFQQDTPFGKTFVSESAAEGTSSLKEETCEMDPVEIASEQVTRISYVISDLDLKSLMDNLDESVHENEKWESFVDERNDSISYCVKRCLPEDGGPRKYLSTIVFNFCSPEMLRDFYMDRVYRKDWDNGFIDQEQLQVDETNGTEVVRIMRSLHYLPPKEYILARRLWEGRDGTYYLYTKECDHPLAPRQPEKYLRVGLYRCGWRIRKVPGSNSCEIKMVHQEQDPLDGPLEILMSAPNLWHNVRKRDIALRKYIEMRRLQPTSAVSAITLIQKVPLAMESTSNSAGSERKPLGRPSKKVIASGLIFLGCVICLAGNGKFAIKHRRNKELPGSGDTPTSKM